MACTAAGMTVLFILAGVGIAGSARAQTHFQNGFQNVYPDARAESSFRQAKVLSSTPIIGQVPYTREGCQTVQVYQQGNTSGIGAVLGGIVGGVVGSQFGGGSGRVALTGAGAIGGALTGNSLEKRGPGKYVNEVQCGSQVVTETRTLGFQVVYELDGKQHVVKMTEPPGATVLVR